MSGYPMGDDIDLALGDAVYLAQDLRALARHHHDAVAASRQLLHHLALRGVRIAQDGMQGGHHGHADFLEQGEDVAPRRSAVDAEFVLHAQHVRRCLKLRKSAARRYECKSFSSSSKRTRGGYS